MQTRRPDEVRAWLKQRPPLAELRAAYPAEYQAVQRDIAKVAATGDAEQLKAYVMRIAQPASRAASSGRRSGRDAQLAADVRRYIAAAALKELLASAATGVTGRVRFNLLNCYLAQKLLFERDLVRKPVSMFWFRALWPLLWQRRFLMPLVGPKGIYCFYSKRLIKSLAAMISDRESLEIAAGDGTLSRFLRAEGVRITATDDHSWAHAVTFGDDVVQLDAREALRVHQPQVVLCSWPPAGNPFERDVFATPSVELYVVISSRHEFAAGNWVAYEQQTDFTFAEDPELSRLVLPPELEAAVYVFKRSGT